MPQVDLDSLVAVCGGVGSDRKIACETLADDAPVVPDVPNDVPADFPPESFWLSKDAEFDWFDRNAFFERKESTKGNSNSTNLNPSVNPHHSNSNSQRFSSSLKSKAGILGLPKTQKNTYVVDSKRRNCKPVNIRLFPKRTESVGKTPAGSVTEPSSPKVSCIGRVRSKRCRYKKPSGPEKPAGEERTGKGQKSGFMSRLASLFRSDGQRVSKNKKKPVAKVDKSPEESVTLKEHEFPVKVEPVAEPPSLGGMTRFASGRISESWSGADDIDVASRDSLDLGRRGI